MCRQFTLPDQVTTIINRLNAAGYSAYAVGGCVRDMLRGTTPNDWDITTSARPEQTMAVFADETIIPTGLQHGTVAIYLDNTLYEVTTYRIDGDYTDSRHPDKVTFVSDVTADLARRDFTINAMAYHPQTGIVDPFGGQQDLKDGIIRCVGNPKERFAEDALRIMRAVRFSSTLSYSIEENTAAAIHEMANSLNRIAVERIMSELYKLLCGDNVKDILLSFDDVIFTVIPELAASKGFYQNTPYHTKDVWEHIVESIAQVKNEPLLRFTMLLHDIAKPLLYYETEEYPYIDSDKVLTIGHFKTHPEWGAQMCEGILRDLKCDNKTIKTITTLIFWHDTRPKANAVTIKRLMAKMGAENFLLLQEVRRADTKAQRPAFIQKTVAQINEVEALARKLIAENACITIKQLAVSGKDLLSVGIPQGEQIGRALNRLLWLVIEDKLPNEKDALLNAVKDLQ